jgi:hypothetical protein
MPAPLPIRDDLTRGNCGRWRAGSATAGSAPGYTRWPMPSTAGAAPRRPGWPGWIGRP